MIRPWFRALARKCLSGHPFQPTSRPPGRRRTLLRLEGVEERIVYNVLPVAPPGEWPPARSGYGLDGSPPPAPEADPSHPQVDRPEAEDRFHKFQPLDVPSARPTEGPQPLTRERDGLQPPQADATPPPRPSPARGAPGTNPADPPAPTGERPSGPARVAPSTTATDAAPGPARTEVPVPPIGHPPETPARPAPAAQTTATKPVASPARPRGEPSVPAGRAVNAVPSKSSAQAQPTTEVTDGSLLQRYVSNREQAAFTALVQRHGPSVVGVCQRVLGDWHAAQDAAQATFLVLARKAAGLDRGSPLGGWLYRVAYHVALRTRTGSARRLKVERDAAVERPAQKSAEAPPEVEMQEVREALREELARLPEEYRAPLTLCYLDGRTHADAAREIGMPRGSVAKRIGEGLAHLRERLQARGVMM